MLDEHDLELRKRRVYDILKSAKKYDNINDRLQAILEDLVKHYNAKFARVWLVDKERKWLVLKFSAGKYKKYRWRIFKGIHRFSKNRSNSQI